jgi:hypothetical protein
MRIKFIGNGNLTEYHRHGKDEIHFRRGEIRDIPEEMGSALVGDFPGLFVIDIPEPVMDRQIKEPVRRKRI